MNEFFAKDMADVDTNPLIGPPPPPFGLPFLLVQAAPGSISHELLKTTENQSQEELVVEVCTAYHMFIGDGEARDVLEAILGATEPCCFLMVLSGPPIR